ncbi:helix-turn-helix domain-containing protein [Nonomuraea turcica]|uniref:helix-turn-helix domain-containing protein n=1 Tax=Nonomuraea sp. G32 TaxID=3067274 RepID=UPI00273B4E43|nr:helix-turn-helix transcriptional regulator [Nonomuraea sp. G32]MDP4510321.1 helix-turn-helix transcriptional regulator [Nonomuraea sp. G32]
MSGPAFEWKLRELMAMRQMFRTTDLIAPLAERGIELSRSQVYRLVAETPERVTIPLLLALCDILGCGLTDLAVPVDAAQQRPRKRPARKQVVGDTASLPPTAVPKSFFDRR